MTSKWLLPAIFSAFVALLTIPVYASNPTCSFILGFATLKALIDEAEGPEKVGDCLEDQRFNPENGDALQQTTGGLLVWRKADNWTAFTDGYRTWINGPNGLEARLNTEQFDWEMAQPTPTPIPTATPEPQPVVAPQPTATPVVDLGGWQLEDKTYIINLTQTPVKEADVEAHTVQGGNGRWTPTLTMGCVIDGAPPVGTNVAIYWGGSFIGNEDHSLRYRFDSTTVQDVKWRSSANGGTSYLRFGSDGWHLFMSSLVTLPSAGLHQYTDLTVEAQLENGSTLTAVWRVAGAHHAHAALKEACSGQPE